MAQVARNQPQGLARVNRSNPLTRGMFAAYDFAVSTSNVIDGQPLTNIGTPAISKAADRAGVGIAIGNASAGLAFPDYSGKVTTEATIIAVLRNKPGDSTNQGLWMIGDQTGNSDHYPFSGLIYSSDFMPNGSSRWVNGASPVVPFTDPHVLSVQFKNGSQRLAQDGKTAATAALAQNPVFPNGSRLFLPSAGSSYPYTGAFKAVFIWNRYLSDAEIRNIVANPWQLFDAPSQTQFPMAAAAPTGVSGSITWTEASDSVAAAGSVTVSGAAAWTEAADSAALAGSVGSAVGINAAWTEAADSVAIAGSAQVNAAAAWTEAADTISMAGSAGNSVAANISWTEAADVTTVAGSIRINAAGSWTEAGDTAAIFVNVAAAQSAALSWTEAPDSIAIAASITAAPVTGTIAWTEQADIAAKATYPGFYSFTLMRADPISSAGAMSSSAPAFTLMRADSIASSSKMSAAPINQNVNLI